MGSVGIPHTLQTVTINFLHFVLLNLHAVQMEPRGPPPFELPPRGGDGAQLDDPQYHLLPSQFLAVSRCRPLQTVYRPNFHTFRQLPQHCFLPSLSLLTSHLRLLQTFYRPIFYTPHFFPQLLFPFFQVRPGGQAIPRTAPPSPTPAARGRSGEG